MKSKHAMWALLLPTLLVAACAAENDAADTAPEETSHNVRVLELKRSDLEETITLTGRVHAYRATDISAEEGGVVSQIRSPKGSEVNAGEIVIELDRDLLAAEMRAAEATMVLRQYNAERTQKLLDANSASKQEMLIAHTEQEQAAQNFEIARLRHRRAGVRAPFRGIVSERFVELGELVAPGTAVARVVDPYSLKLRGWVTERELASLHPDAPALVSFDGSDEVLSASIAWIGVEASPATGKFSIELAIDNPDLRLRAGVVARARIERAIHRQQLVIPRDAVVRGPHGAAVYVVDGDRARRRDVVLGADQGILVMVESGLTEKETMVVRGQRDLSEDALVEVRERSSLRDGSIDGDPVEVREKSELSPREVADEATPLGAQK